MKVYAIESGEYSDYHILGIFDSKEKAQQIIDKGILGGYNFRIAEFVLNELFDILCQKDKTPFEILMKIDGSVEKIRKDQPVYAHNLLRGYTTYGEQDLAWVTVMAKNEQHAVKIANEKRIKFLHERDLK